MSTPTPLSVRVFTRERLTIYPIAALATSLIIWLAVILLGDPPRTLGGGTWLPDFLAYWTGGRMVADGDTTLLYDPAAQFAQQRGFAPSGGDGLSWFVAPPLVALAYVPLGVLPYVVAAPIFLAVSLAVIVLAGRLLVDEFSAENVPVPPRFFLVLAAAPPVFEAIGSGQTTPFVLLGWLLALRAHRRGRKFSSGAFLALTAFKPHLLVFVPFWLVARREWRTAAGFVSILAAVGAATVLLFGTEITRTWFDTILGGSFGEFVAEGQTWKMQSVGGLLVDLTSWRHADLVAVLAGAGVMATVAWRRHESSLQAFAWLALVTVTFAPHVMLYDASLLAITAAAIAVAGRLTMCAWPFLALVLLQFTTPVRYALSGLMPPASWAWPALAGVWLVVVLNRSDRRAGAAQL